MAFVARPKAAGRRRQNAHRNTDDEGLRIDLEDQKRELVIDLIEGEQTAPRRDADQASEQRAAERDDQREPEVMRADLAAGISEGLEQSDLLALGMHHARDDDVEQEGRNGEEYRRHGAARDFESAYLLMNEAVRHMIVDAIGAEPAPWFQQAVDARSDPAQVRIAGERKLNAPLRSQAAASALSLIQMTAKRASSGANSPGGAD